MRKSAIKSTARVTYELFCESLGLKIIPEFKVCKLKPHNRGMIICYDAAEDEPARVIIKISSRRGENENLVAVVSTVLHELIHQYQFEHKLPVEHDRLFANFAADILASCNIDIK